MIRRMNYTHPTYTFAALDAQKRLHRLNEQGTSLFCGSYFGYGFHEDAVRSAVHVARDLGVKFFHG